MVRAEHAVRFGMQSLIPHLEHMGDSFMFQHAVFDTAKFGLDKKKNVTDSRKRPDMVYVSTRHQFAIHFEIDEWVGHETCENVVGIKKTAIAESYNIPVSRITTIRFQLRMQSTEKHCRKIGKVKVVKCKQNNKGEKWYHLTSDGTSLIRDELGHKIDEICRAECSNVGNEPTCSILRIN
jgi:predicted transcriptional regulator